MMLVPLAISLLLAMPQDLDPDLGSSPNPSSQSYSSSWVLGTQFWLSGKIPLLPL